MWCGTKWILCSMMMMTLVACGGLDPKRVGATCTSNADCEDWCQLGDPRWPNGICTTHVEFGCPLGSEEPTRLSDSEDREAFCVTGCDEKTPCPQGMVCAADGVVETVGGFSSSNARQVNICVVSR
jgi:hypothetical protein